MSILTQETFTKGMARLNAVFPDFKPTDATWEEYWRELHVIPAEHFELAIGVCLMGAWFPRVGQIVMAAVGNDVYEYRGPQLGARKLGVDELLKRFKEDFDKPKLPAPEKNTSRPEDIIFKLQEQIKFLGYEKDDLMRHIAMLNRKVDELEAQVKKPTIEERKLMLEEQAKILGIVPDVDVAPSDWMDG